MSAEASYGPSARRTFLKWAAGLGAGAAVAALAWQRRARVPVRVASHRWPGYEFMFLARDAGWMSPDDVDFLETPTTSASQAAFIAGRVDGAALTLDECVDAVAAGSDVTVVLLFDMSAGADAVFARSTIANPAALRGRRIALERSSLGRLMLRKVLDAGGLAPGDVDTAYIEGSHEEAWRDRRIDAIVTYEPFASAIEAGGGRRIFDSREMPHKIFDVLAVRSEQLHRHEAHLGALLTAHFRALRAWNTNPVDTAYRLARHYRTTAEQVTAQFRGMTLPDLDYNRHQLGAPARDLHQAVADLSAVLELPEQVRRRLTTGLTFDSGLLPARLS